MMDNEQLWQATLGELELMLSKANYTTWLKNTFISSFDAGLVTIGVANAFTQTYLKNKYHQQILTALRNVTDGSVKDVTYKVETKQNGASVSLMQGTRIPQASAQNTPVASSAQQTSINHCGLNNKYIFETFIVGKGNELAHAAAQAIAKNPGQVYNPLFIYGGVGLGKTHLMQAIGNEILKRAPQKKILYTTCEQFTNDYVSAIRNGNIDQFRNKYRKIDVLLVDDIQFMAGKEGTQEEFFHTFNDFHQTNRQMVMNSDRLPKAIPALEKRLISRFEWGMIADISQPDLETRMAILKSKCIEKNFALDHEIIHYIATHVQSNIRELEGALNKLLVQCDLLSQKPSLDMARQVFSSISSSHKKSVTNKELLNTISEFYDITFEDLIGKSREKKLVVPRQIAMYLLREDLKNSYPTIGDELGGRDHTTAMHAYNKILRDIDNEEKIKREIEMIRQRMYG